MRRSLALSLILAAAAFGLNRWAALLAATPPVMTAAAGEVLYATGFEAWHDDWQTFDDGQLSARIEAADPASAGMRVRAEKAGVSVSSTVRWQFADFDYSVMTAAVGGPVDNGYGVVFRYRDPANHYAFYVSSDGYYKVVRTLNGQSVDLSAWMESPLVNPGLGAVNTLRVVGVGDTFRFYLNGQAVPVCVPDDPAGVSTYAGGACIGGALRDTLTDGALPSGRIGVAVITPAEPDVEAAFDNVLVRMPALP
jgi:hypothetical protein